METPEAVDPQELTVRRLGREGEELAVFEFEGNLRDVMLANLREGYLATGNYGPDAKAISPQAAASLAVAGSAVAATAASAAFSSTLFMATANPATLMQLSSGGFSSAIMGPSGIVAHAGFVPVASALPVVAPILAIQALNTAVIMQQFKQVDQKLGEIKRTLDKVVARIEATHAGELLAASRMVDDVYSQYSLSGSFSQDMLVRLALAERDVNSLAIRFRQLVEAHGVTATEDVAEVHQTNYDAHSAMLASFVALRVSYLRVCIDMQENPGSVNASVERLKAVMDDDIVFWQQLQDRSRDLKAEIDKLTDKLEGMGWSDRLPGASGATLEKKIDKLTAAYTLTMESERDIMREFHSLIDSTQTARAALDKPPTAKTSPTLVYWRDETGEHSFVTDREILSVKG